VKGKTIFIIVLAFLFAIAGTVAVQLKTNLENYTNTNSYLLSLIENNNIKYNINQEQLLKEKSNLTNEYNLLIDKYNELVNKYNLIVDQNNLYNTKLKMSRCEMWDSYNKIYISKPMAVNGIYWSNTDFYCVWSKDRELLDIEKTDRHEYCHNLVENNYNHFCKEGFTND